MNVVVRLSVVAAIAVALAPACKRASGGDTLIGCFKDEGDPAPGT